MLSIFRTSTLAAVLLVAFTLFAAACGDEDEPAEETSTEEAASSDTGTLDPAAVEESVQGFLEGDEVAGELAPTVDCGDEATETVECEVSGAKGLTGAVAASPSAGFQYTGEIEGPDGPSSVGGSAPEGSVSDPASVEASLNETLSDDAGAPTADCPDEAEGESLECEVTGDDVSGTVTVTPIGGFEWEGQIETPDGTRSISGNALP